MVGNPGFRPFMIFRQFMPDQPAILDLGFPSGRWKYGDSSIGLNHVYLSPSRLHNMSTFYILHSAEQLHDRIHLTLSRDPYVGGRPVQFELIDGDILLTGAVSTYYQKQMAQESLRHIQGVGRIVNELEVVRSR